LTIITPELLYRVAYKHKMRLELDTFDDGFISEVRHHARTMKWRKTEQSPTRRLSWNSSSNFCPQMLIPPFPVPTQIKKTASCKTVSKEVDFATQ